MVLIEFPPGPSLDSTRFQSNNLCNTWSLRSIPYTDERFEIKLEFLQYMIESILIVCAYQVRLCDIRVDCVIVRALIW